MPCNIAGCVGLGIVGLKPLFVILNAVKNLVRHEGVTLFYCDSAEKGK
jgi:hypothetical protein